VASIAILVLCPCPDEARIMIEIRMVAEYRDSTLYEGFDRIQFCHGDTRMSIPTPDMQVSTPYVKDGKRH
jgi:hypothetical protein